MRQLGCYARQLFGLRFPTIGLLIEGDDGYCIDECLSPGYVLQDRETIEELPRGPFHNEVDYYCSLATALRLHAEQLPMEHHVLRAPVPIPEEYTSFAKYYTATDRWNDFVSLGGMVDSSVNRLQYCLASHFLQDSIIPGMVCPVNQLASGFPLNHQDISLQNLFVDDGLNITCVIDWAFSSTVPPAQLLAPPGLPHPRDLVSDLSLIDAFRFGFETKNRKIGEYVITSSHWKIGQMVVRFMRLVNLDALQDYSHLEALYVLAQGSGTPGDDGDDTNSLPAILASRAMTHDALLLASELAADDESESEICRREKNYFDAVGAKRLALARRVTVAAKMNPRFVADGRLWRWVDAVMECYDRTGSDELEESSAEKHITSGLGVGKGSTSP
ncbi:protein kinase-like domain [Fusarium austroafricanum]|uniref:Protein kinase-like domain n=1 Tax=Fusarium austroafricanum TaxID=2364996 RepID=A0A8H4KSD0_9HYPO|nr:protein kinase-like domain [Fusarium austroafricanum]